MLVKVSHQSYSTPMPHRRLRQSRSFINPPTHSVHSPQRESLSGGELMLWAEKQRQDASRNSLRAAVASASNHGLQSKQRPQTTGGIPNRPCDSPSSSVPVTKVVVRDQMQREPTSSTDVQPWEGTKCDKTRASRQTCEVLGPAACANCRRLRVRRTDVEKSEKTFPALFSTEDNFTTTTRLAQCLPQLSEKEIRDKIASGEICHHTLKEQVESAKTKPNYFASSRKTKETTRKPRMTSDDGVTMTYFNNLIQLNERIYGGRADKHLGFAPVDTLLNPQVELEALKRSRPQTNRAGSTDVLFPAFVSSRKTRPRAPACVVHFDPPLVPRSQQRNEPSFFAGINAQYQLPEQLPDKIISDELAAEVERQLALARHRDEQENIEPGQLIREHS